MRPTSPKPSDLTSSLGKGRFDGTIGYESRDLELIVGEDIEWQKVCVLWRTGRGYVMEDGIIGKSEVTAQHVDENAGRRHIPGRRWLTLAGQCLRDATV